jgi:hypothetical protein
MDPPYPRRKQKSGENATEKVGGKRKDNVWSNL